jgi:hypothetical protein
VFERFHRGTAGGARATLIVLPFPGA